MDEYSLPFISNSSNRLEPGVYHEELDSGPSTGVSDLPTTSVSQCISFVLEEETSPVRKPRVDLGNLPRLCRTKQGSQNLQQLLARARPEVIQQIVDRLAPHIGELMIDQFGNYACQSLFSSCSASQRLTILEHLRPFMGNLAKNSRGTHSLQTLIGLSSLPQEEAIYLECFRGQVMDMAKNLYASYVLQKLLVTLTRKQLLVNELLPSLHRLACDKLGLCVVKKCVQFPEVSTALTDNALILIQDPYGNYAVQAALEYWHEAAATSILRSIQGKVLQLSVQKFASNVIEKCLNEPSMRVAIIQELISENVHSLLNSPFGCYVLRTAAAQCPPELKSSLYAVIELAMQKAVQKQLSSRWDEVLRLLRG